MLAGLLFASVFGAFAMPEVINLVKSDDEEGRAPEDEGERATAEGEADMIEDVPAPEAAADDPAPAGDEPEPAPQQPSEPEAQEAEDPADTPQPEPETEDPSAEPQEPAEDLVAEISEGGTYAVPEFDADTQSLTLRVPENTTFFKSMPADPDAEPPLAPSVTFEAPNGSVELMFEGRDSVPVEAVAVAKGASGPQPLEDMLLTDEPSGEITEPLSPSVIEDEVDGYTWAPSTGDAPTGEVPEDDGPQESSGEITKPLSPSVIEDEVDGYTWAPATGDAPTGEVPNDDGPQEPSGDVARDLRLIDGFDPETDVLTLSLDGPEGVSTGPSEDGQHGEVKLDEVMIVRVLGVPDLEMGDLRFAA